jgi:hypothetical protein
MNSFHDICTSKCFLIPTNQRGFSWAERDAEAVFSDLELADVHSHYMGPVIVTRTVEPDFLDDSQMATAEFYLDDGQQRLSTFFIIASLLRQRLESLNGGPYIETHELERLLFYRKGGLQLRLRNKNADLDNFFSYIITGSPSPPARRSPPMVALEKVKAAVSHKLAPLSASELVRWKHKITNQAKFILVDLARENVDRYLTFDAINSRGLPLSEFDKIKNFCILVATKRGLRIKPESDWYKAIQHLESFEVSSRADEAAFIAELYAAFFNERVVQGQVHAAFVEKFTKLLTAPDAALEAQLKDFIRLWEPMAKSFAFVATKKRKSFYSRSLCSKGTEAWLDRLDNLGLPTITRTVLTACHYKLSKAEFEKCARACEVFTFRTYAAGPYRKDKHASHIVKLAHDVLVGGKVESDVLARICRWLKDLAPMSKFIAELANGKAKYAADPDVRGWSYCYYFLYEYELDCSPRGVSPLNWLEPGVGRDNSQEHILPQKHRDGGWWASHWVDAAVAEAFKHRLGNLTLTTNNSALGRKAFHLKVTDPSGSHCYTHRNATNSEKRVPRFTNGTDWLPANILQREYELLEFASRRWSIPCCSDNGSVPLPPEFAALGPNYASITVACGQCVAEASQEADHVEENFPDDSIEDDNKF